MKSPRSLRTYRAKRDFQKTSEPEPGAEAPRGPGEPPIFVVHKHDATRLHYDLRLEIDGALASWALPKGPSFDPKTKRLAVETEDHPLAYAGFEGRIPEGEYGGGDSLLWDRGTYETVPPGEAHAQRQKGHLTVQLHGEKLKGRWHLIRTKPRGKKAQWLCFKAVDGEENPDYDVTAEHPESVKSGRRATRGPVRKAARKQGPLPVEQLLQRVWPPMLAQLSVPEQADDATHLYEVKYDGFRALAALSSGTLTLDSRNGNDLAARFPQIAEALRGLRVTEAVLDGEIVALDAEGRSRFQLLQQGSGAEQRFVAFDLLWLDGEDLRQRPLEARRELLEQLLAGVKPPIQLSERLELPGDKALAEARRRGWEGLIAKRKGSAYVGSRSGDWLKLKVQAGQEAVILGYLPIKNERAKEEIGALLVGVHGPDGYHDVGKVGTGFTSKTRRELRALLDRQRVKAPAAVDAKARAGAVWVKPKYVAQLQFTEWTSDGRLRHPVFQGLRTDKKPEEVVREKPQATAKASRSSGSRRAPTALAARSTRAAAPKAPPAEDTGMARLTHGDRVLFPEDGFTKQDVFDYYREAAPLLLPVLANRPLAVQQWPAGIQAPGFFRHELSGMPGWLPTLRVKHEEKTLRHVNVQNVDALLWLANQSALTLHVWSSHAPKLAQPDWVVFDLDPGKGGWEDLLTVARLLREKLEALGLESLPKTSGKRGLHVLVPLAPGHTYAQTQRFSERIAAELEAELGSIATTERSISKRRGRLYLDVGQNGRGKTVVAPYSLRAIAGAPFSAPLKWSEVTRKLDPLRFNLKTLAKRLDAVGDLFAQALQGTQTLE
ncbi:ATP-dependent DNA ligase LigD phosphoesterase module /ATP-dependent DNA ligase LigD polymerase module [Stigmatella aurantiaca]|uniref:DNA ligase (ATP) n=1 Tax=Stigmatella aurantiaca TaxID=41 RepID=A0A1H7ZJQ8_STIAU|nr:DNA ligase D [Stigmatella aurantiaca]SEM58640.1 ATP-dependent DNA ligase LigD phosphoesterase module /ATP-dependent DNA ligase LigD polymerase module [Stigmatella aurantiaca]